MTLDRKIVVVGLGYVGIATTALLASKHKVRGIDINPCVVDKLSSGQPHLKETGLKKTLEDAKGNISFTNKLDIPSDTSMVFLCLPTDFDDQKNQFETSVIEKFFEKLHRSHFEGVIVLKSTVGINFLQQIQEKYPSLKMLYCPEFLREGMAIQDSFYPSRLIIGGDYSLAKQLSNVLIKCLKSKDVRTHFMTSSEAEATKLLSNTALALRVSLFNEIDNICMKFNLGTETVINGISDDPRIGHGYNNPSFGFGGYCLPKDSKQLASQCSNMIAPIINLITESNNKRLDVLVQDIVRTTNGNSIGIYRLQMKKGSDNIRSSRSLDLALALSKAGFEIQIYEPLVNETTLYNLPVNNDLNNFMDSVDRVIANRMDDCISEHKQNHKIYTRDIFWSE